MGVQELGQSVVGVQSLGTVMWGYRVRVQCYDAQFCGAKSEGTVL